MDYSGACFRFTAWCYGFAHAGLNDAATGWRTMPKAYRHRHHRHPPAGAVVFWTGGSHGFGHAAISAGGGKIYSTDIRRSGRVDLVPLGEIEQQWHLVFEGWARPYYPSAFGANPNHAPTITGRMHVVNLANMQESAMEDP